MSTPFYQILIRDVNSIIKSTYDVCKRLTGGLKPVVIKYRPKTNNPQDSSDDETRVLLKRLLQTLFFGILFILPLGLYSPTDSILKNSIYPLIIFILFSLISLYMRYKAKIISLVHSKSSGKMEACLGSFIPEYEKLKNDKTYIPKIEGVSVRLPFPHNCMVPMHATLVAIGVVYLLKIYTYPNFLLTFLSLTVASCQYSLIKIPYKEGDKYAKFDINDGNHYTRCSYFISCVGILAFQNLCQSSFKKIFVDFEYKSVSFLVFDITQYMKDVLYNFMPLQCLFFAFDILPNIKKFYKFLLGQSDSKPKSSRNHWFSQKIALLYKPAIKLIFSFFENKFLLHFVSLLFQGGASYLMFTFFPKIGHTFPNTFYYSIYFGFVCFFSYLYSNSLIKFVFIMPQKYLSKKFKKSGPKEKKDDLADVFKENTKCRSHLFKKEAAIASIFIFLSSFIISIVYLTFYSKLEKLKKILFFTTMIIGLIKYPILLHPWTFHIFSMFKGKVRITDDIANTHKKKEKNNNKAVLKYLKIGFEFFNKYMLMFPFILITLINNIDKLLESEKSLIIAITVATWSSRLFSLVFKNPTVIPFSMMFVGLYNDWNYAQMTLCGVIDLMIIDEIFEFMFSLKRYIKIFIANIIDSYSSATFLIVILFYLTSINFYLMLIPLVAFFKLNLYSLYGRRILLATFKSQDYLPDKCVKKIKKDDPESKKDDSMTRVLNMIRPNLFHYVDKNKLGFVEEGDCICFEYQSEPYLLKIDKIKSNKVAGELKRIPKSLMLTSNQNFKEKKISTKFIESIKHSLSNVQYFPITHKWPWRDFFEIPVKDWSEADIVEIYDQLKKYISSDNAKLKNIYLTKETKLDECPCKSLDDMIKVIEEDQGTEQYLCFNNKKSFIIATFWLIIICRNLKAKNVSLDDAQIGSVFDILFAGETKEKIFTFHLKISVKSNKKLFYFKRHTEFDQNTFYPVKINPNYLSHIFTSLEFVSSPRYGSSEMSGDLNYKLGTISVQSIIDEGKKQSGQNGPDFKTYSPFYSTKFVSYRLASKLTSTII